MVLLTESLNSSGSILIWENRVPMSIAVTSSFYSLQFFLIPKAGLKVFVAKEQTLYQLKNVWESSDLYDADQHILLKNCIKYLIKQIDQMTRCTKIDNIKCVYFADNRFF